MKVGLKYFMMAKYTESGSTVTYSGGKEVAEMVKAAVNVTTYEVPFYSNNRLSDKESGFKEGSITLDVDGISLEDQATLLGATYTAAVTTSGSEAPAKIESSTNDVAPFVGVGFVTTSRKGGANKYLAYIYPKVKFSEPSESIDTKGESTSMNAESLPGTITADANGNWRIKTEHATEAAALAAIKTYLSIS